MTSALSYGSAFAVYPSIVASPAGRVWAVPKRLGRKARRHRTRHRHRRTTQQLPGGEVRNEQGVVSISLATALDTSTATLRSGSGPSGLDVDRVLLPRRIPVGPTLANATSRMPRHWQSPPREPGSRHRLVAPGPRAVLHSRSSGHGHRPYRRGDRDVPNRRHAGVLMPGDPSPFRAPRGKQDVHPPQSRKVQRTPPQPKAQAPLSGDLNLQSQ